jgi:hypothetical protein
LRDSTGFLPDFALSHWWDLHGVRLNRTFRRLATGRRAGESPYTDPMIRRPILVLAALAAAVLAFKKRPVRPPKRSGAWEPVELER